MKKLHLALTATIALTLLLTLAACGSKTESNHADRSFATSSNGIYQNETDLQNECLIELVSRQSPPSNSPIAYFACYRDVVTDIMYMNSYHIGSSVSAGGLTVMLDPDSGKPFAYARCMDLYSALHS